MAERPQWRARVASTGLDPRRRLPVPVASGSSRYLSEDERVFIADRLLARSSLRSIARELGRSPSTISRELARNRPDTRRYPSISSNFRWPCR
ncbi:helix-turn-helix domain-containing protein [Arthrobacter bambusae]|uniref:helix-turn-helix domain-containing protein n=1 Tax=Arthrobacter bambusae TaxID=1338426 RepID=UPI0035583471